MNEDEFQKQQEFEKLKKEVLRKVLTKNAIERLGRVRIVNPILVQQVEAYLLQLYQMGQIKEMIDDKKLKQILGMLTEKKDWSIKRR